MQSTLDSVPQNDLSQDAAPVEKLIHLALPVRLIYNQNGGRGAEMSCTYDIHPRGARLLSSREVRVGDLITVERGRSKSVCQVVWTADPQTALRGQFTVECLDRRVPWEEELRQMEERYLPLIAPGAVGRPALNSFRVGRQNRRRRPRFVVEGGADVAEIGGRAHVEGQLQQISEFGCLIRAGSLLAPGTGLKLVLNMCDVSVALHGQVRSVGEGRGMGVEFEEIRQGDRPLLEYVLEQVKQSPADDFPDLEVITEHLTAAAR